MNPIHFDPRNTRYAITLFLFWRTCSFALLVPLEFSMSRYETVQFCLISCLPASNMFAKQEVAAPGSKDRRHELTLQPLQSPKIWKHFSSYSTLVKLGFLGWVLSRVSKYGKVLLRYELLYHLLLWLKAFKNQKKSVWLTFLSFSLKIICEAKKKRKWWNLDKVCIRSNKKLLNKIGKNPMRQKLLPWGKISHGISSKLDTIQKLRT